MADIPIEGQGKKKKGGKKVKRLSTRIDMTPMVDLAFLLITFFMLTTTLIKPQTMEIAMPSKEKVKEDEQTQVKASRAITVILAKNNKVFYYEGTREGEVDPKVQVTDFSSKGIWNFLIQKNIDVMQKIEELKKEKIAKDLPDSTFERRKTEIMGDKKAPIVIIKATDEASYKNLIDILDEMAITNIGRYAIVDITPYDLELIKNLNI